MTIEDLLKDEGTAEVSNKGRLSPCAAIAQLLKLQMDCQRVFEVSSGMLTNTSANERNWTQAVADMRKLAGAIAAGVERLDQR